MEPNLTARDQNRAEPVRPPQATPAMQATQKAHELHLEVQERVERHSVLRGIVALMLLAIIFASLRAGMDRVFYTGWWRQW